MSELKAYGIRVIDGLVIESESGQLYIKSEADKVIKELEDELRAANEQIENLINSASNIMLFQDRVNDNKCAELRHHKYKRCLAMARIAKDDWHLHNSFYAMGLKEFEKRKCDFYEKWRNRWMELAERFKEAK